MEAIFTNEKIAEELGNPVIPQLGILIIYQFSDGSEKFFVRCHTREEFNDLYDINKGINEFLDYPELWIEELFQCIADNSLKENANKNLEMSIAATLPEAKIIINKNASESIGVTLRLFEDNPKATKLSLQGYADWEITIEMLENDSVI